MFNCLHCDEHGFCRKCSTLDVDIPCSGDGDCAGYEVVDETGFPHWATEQAYKNGYAKGYADGKAENVSCGVLDQVRWERDVAMQQLEEHGIPFCGIAPDVVKVVRCKDCKHRGDDVHCPMCFEELREWDYDGYRETDFVLHDRTTDDGFCHNGERKDNGK